MHILGADSRRDTSFFVEGMFETHVTYIFPAFYICKWIILEYIGKIKHSGIRDCSQYHYSWSKFWSSTRAEIAWFIKFFPLIFACCIVIGILFSDIFSILLIMTLCILCNSYRIYREKEVLPLTLILDLLSIHPRPRTIRRLNRFVYTQTIAKQGYMYKRMLFLTK